MTTKTKTEDQTTTTFDPGTESVTLTDERKVTWGYTRKKNLGNDEHGNPRYESEEVSLYVTDACPAEEANIMEWVSRVSEPAFGVIKPAVWDALGLTYEYNEVGLPILDDHKAEPSAPSVPPITTARTTTPSPLPDRNRVPNGTETSPGGVTTTPPPRGQGGQASDPPVMAQIGYYAEQPPFCKKCGEREFYDNRIEVDELMKQGKKARPDFKCKGCGSGVFRPGSYEYNKAVG